MVSRRVPAAAPALAPEQLAGATLGRIAGVYSITDDWYPIVGASKWVEGFYEAVGGSGHSFKIGPPIGEALAQVIAGREPDIDISALSHSRFDEGKVFASVWGAGNRG
jgi:sarcosine oxidase subunit beta